MAYTNFNKVFNNCKFYKSNKILSNYACITIEEQTSLNMLLYKHLFLYIINCECSSDVLLARLLQFQIYIIESAIRHGGTIQLNSIFDSQSDSRDFLEYKL